MTDAAITRVPLRPDIYRLVGGGEKLDNIEVRRRRAVRTALDKARDPLPLESDFQVT